MAEATSYVYIRSEPQLFTVGFYTPDGKWQAESDHPSREEAADRRQVHFLNGGDAPATEGTALQLRLAEEAGDAGDGETWLDRYKYHLGMVDNPLPFERFKLKCGLLNQYLEADPDGHSDAIDRKIQRLSVELGY